MAITTAQGVKNGVYITKKIMQAFGLSDFQAVGFAGCWMCESHCNPGAYNKEEKAGTFKGSSANGSGYGAGLALWSNEWKKKILKQFNRYTPIENWTMDLLIAIVTQGCSASFILLLKNCSTVGLSTDIILRGYENGSAGKGTTLRSLNSMKAYTWCKTSYVADSGYKTFADGYIGALTARTSWSNKILLAMGSTNLDDLNSLGSMTFNDGSNSTTDSGAFGGSASAYPVHSEYTTYSGTGGNIFSNAANNAFLTASTSYYDASANTASNSNTKFTHTRIYSTNDASIILDELTLPIEYMNDNNTGLSDSSARVNANNIYHNKTTVTTDTTASVNSSTNK